MSTPPPHAPSSTTVERAVRRHRRSASHGGDGDGGPSDAHLLASMATGHAEDGTTFVRRHERRVYAIALAITGDRVTAEDVAQEAFIKAFRHAALFDDRRAPVSSWLGAITRNLAIDAVRAARAIPVERDDPLWLGAVSAEPAIETTVIHRDQVERVKVALGAIPIDQRRALVRAAFYGVSAATVAAAEGIALGTAKGRIRLALAKVRAALEDEEVS